MRYVSALFVFGSALMAPQLAHAGALYGTVTLGPAPAAGVQVAVACPTFAQPSQSPAPVTTDERGSFSLLVNATGRCEMRINRGGQAGAPFEVFVSDNPLRLDVEIDNALNRVR